MSACLDNRSLGEQNLRYFHQELREREAGGGGEWGIGRGSAKLDESSASLRVPQVRDAVINIAMSSTNRSRFETQAYLKSGVSHVALTQLSTVNYQPSSTEKQNLFSGTTQHTIALPFPGSKRSSEHRTRLSKLSCTVRDYRNECATSA